MQKIDVAGLKVDGLTKTELLTIILSSMIVRKKTWVTTVYSEFLYVALKDPRVMEMLNKADIAVPDGIGIFWAHKFLSIPLTTKSYLGKILQALWQIKYSLAAILFNRSWIYSVSPEAEKIPGSELVWEIAKLAAENKLSIYLLGGFGNTAELTANKLISQSANKLSIAGYSSKNPDDQSTIDDINKSNADILFVSYGPIKQEQWILKHRDELPNVKLLIGLGGTFDYIAGKRISPPSIIRKIGLEWLFRLITQPYRIKRIWNATFGLCGLLWHYKVFNSLPLRKNVVAIILNNQNQVLVCRRDPKNHHVDIIHSKESLSVNNYWQFPQGGVDAKEDLQIAAVREAEEETGLKNLQFLKISNNQHTYYWNNALRKFWKNRRHPNCGQTQSIVYFTHIGSDSDVKIDNDEFVEYKWESINNLLFTIHQERFTLAKIVQTDLKEMQEKAII